MPKHHTAFYEIQNTRKAEEVGGDSFGVAPFYALLSSYYHHFSPRTRPLFHKRAQQYLSGLFHLDHRRNLEKIDECVDGSEYQSLHHFLSNSPWDAAAVCGQIARDVNDLLGGSQDSCLIIDPSGIPKKGQHSVGVGRQYCGNVGKVDNCQIGVFAALGRGRNACLINKRLYLPRDWTADHQRCEKAGIPEDRRAYKSRAQLAFELIDDADKQGLDYAWIGMDAEFGVPWILSELDRKGKRFLVDIASTAYLYKKNPRLKYQPRRHTGTGLSLKKKPVQASAIRESHGKRRWRRVEIRDSSKGLMVAEFLHKRVWFWDRETEPRLWHLIIRRIPKEDGVGWNYKYSLSNAPLKTPTERLAYQQSQRFWVEQAIKDGKDSLGLDEYQVRKWKAWHHHVAMTMLAGLYVLKTRLSNKEALPMLSITDVREILLFFLPKKVKVFADIMTRVHQRHERRRRAYLSARDGTGVSRPKTNSEVKVTK